MLIKSTHSLLFQFIVIFSLLFLAACSTENNESNESANTSSNTETTTTSTTTSPNATANAVSLDNPYVRAMPPAHPNSAMFITLNNSSEKPIRLISAATTVAETVELHAHRHKDGMMQMYQVPHIEIPAQGSAELKPGGLHIMLLGLKQTLKAGDEIEMTLNFDDNSSMTVKAPVKKIEPKM